MKINSILVKLLYSRELFNLLFCIHNFCIHNVMYMCRRMKILCMKLIYDEKIRNGKYIKKKNVNTKQL